MTSDAWRSLVECDGNVICQGYLSLEKERTVRIRTADRKGYITINGIKTGYANAELEYEIPFTDAQDLLENLSIKPLIEKKRYTIRHQGRTWEIDEFAGANQGLLVAEIELDDEGEQFSLPAWVAADVSSDYRFLNVSLVQTPFSRWGSLESNKESRT